MIGVRQISRMEYHDLVLFTRDTANLMNLVDLNLNFVKRLTCRGSNFGIETGPYTPSLPSPLKQIQVSNPER